MEHWKSELENLKFRANVQFDDAETAPSYEVSEQLDEANADNETNHTSADLAGERVQARKIMADADRTSAEADVRHGRVSSEAHSQAQEIIARADLIKAEADANHARLTEGADQAILDAATGQLADMETLLKCAAGEALWQANDLCAHLAEECAQAQQSIAGVERAMADAGGKASAYCAQVTTEAQSQAQEIIRDAENSRAEADAYSARLRDKADQNILAGEEVRSEASTYAERARAEADDYHKRVTAESQKQAREIIADAENARAEAEALEVRLAAEADQNILAGEKVRSEANAYAEKARAEADAYYEDVRAESRKQAEEIITDAEKVKSRANSYAEKARAEADAYHKRVSAESQKQAEEIISAAEKVKTNANAYAEKARSEVEAYSARLRAEADQNILAGEKVRSEANTYAERTRAETDVYCEDVRAESQKQAQEIVTGAENAKANAEAKTSAYCVQITADAKLQAQKINADAENFKAEADAYSARLRAEADQNILAGEKAKSEANTYADKARAEADAYCEGVRAESLNQAQEIITAGEKVRSEANTYRDELVASMRQRCRDLMSEFVLAAEVEVEVGVNEGNARGQSIQRSWEKELIAGKAKSDGKRAKPVQPKTDSPTLSIENVSLEETAFRNEFGGAGGREEDQLILGLDFNGSSKAFPVSTINARRVINDSITGHEVVIVFEPTLEAGLAFNRTVDGQDLTFSFYAVNERGMTLMGDAETGTTWEALTGRAIQGPLMGQDLAKVDSEHAGLYEWQKQHPNTTVYQDTTIYQKVA